MCYSDTGRNSEDDHMRSDNRSAGLTERYEALYRAEKEKYVKLAGEVAALEEKNSLMKWRLSRMEGSRLFSLARKLSSEAGHRKGNPFVRPVKADASEESLKIYNEKLGLFRDPYPIWIEEKESKAFEKHSELSEGDEPDTSIMWLEAADKSCVDERAEKIAAKYFEENPEVNIWYADEDMITESGERCFPWFKQEPFPESLLGCYYFGSMTAFRREAFAEEDIRGIYKDKIKLYALVLKECFKEGGFKKVGHTPLVLYHGRINAEEKKIYSRDTGIAPCVFGYEPEYEGIKKEYEKAGKTGRLSVIIPTKDHPAMLARCLKSLNDTADISDIELVIVDNGSDDKNKKAYEDLFERLRKSKRFSGIDYLHKQAEFNFARMCNRGAKRSSGDYLLFLNDDTYFSETSGLKDMMAQASAEGIGAVGAKLLYPDGRVQHAGVTNLVTGPAHKLQGVDGNTYPYYNFGMTEVNMLAVTAACLMIKKSRFSGVGGFDESFMVAYNDVDLCMRLFEKGYRNVQRNDVVLYHDESVSRGNDLLDDEKWERLSSERERLYKLHKGSYGADPFYPRNLRKDSAQYIADAYNKQESRQYRDKSFEVFQENMFGRICGDIKINVDVCGIRKKFDLDEKDTVEIRGWAFMEGADNARYKRRLILYRGDDMRAYELEGQYMPELKTVFPDERNILLSGFCIRPDTDSFSEGAWYLAVEFKDIETGSRYYAKSEAMLHMD